VIIVDARIVERLEKHVVQAHRHLCQTVHGGVFEQSEDWVRGYTGSSISTFNLLLLLNDNALTDDLLSDTAAYFDEQRVPHVVAFDEHRTPGGTNFLDSRSYQPLPPLPGMILLGPHRRLRTHPDLAVERVDTADGMSIFRNLISELFGLPLKDTRRLFPAEQLQNHSIRHYVGYLEDVPIVMGTGVQAEGVVSVWNVATHDVVRRQRVATGLMDDLLQEAWEDGCDVSLLYSSPMAYSLYQKLGYELYTQRRCFLPPEW
jgi:GNAT superfamily N-acetyltransferase